MQVRESVAEKNETEGIDRHGEGDNIGEEEVDSHREDVDVSRRQDRVGQERRDEMPWVESEEGGDEVDSVGREDRDDHLGVDGLSVVGGCFDGTEDGGCIEKEARGRGGTRSQSRNGGNKLTGEKQEGLATHRRSCTW